MLSGRNAGIAEVDRCTSMYMSIHDWLGEPHYHQQDNAPTMKRCKHCARSEVSLIEQPRMNAFCPIKALNAANGAPDPIRIQSAPGHFRRGFRTVNGDWSGYSQGTARVQRGYEQGGSG